jgi:hypothetical protein
MGKVKTHRHSHVAKSSHKKKHSQAAKKPCDRSHKIVRHGMLVCTKGDKRKVKQSKKLKLGKPVKRHGKTCHPVVYTVAARKERAKHH